MEYKEEAENITHTVVRLDFDKKIAFRQQAIACGLTIQEMFNKFVDLVIEKDEYLLKHLNTRKKPEIKEEDKKEKKIVSANPSFNENEIDELYDLFEQEE